MGDSLCGDCPPVGYPTDETRCTPCPRRPADLSTRAREVLIEAVAKDKPENYGALLREGKMGLYTVGWDEALTAMEVYAAQAVAAERERLNRVHYASLRSAQHAFDIIASNGGMPDAWDHSRTLAEEESARIQQVLDTLRNEGGNHAD